jgi:hypothetical protein
VLLVDVIGIVVVVVELVLLVDVGNVVLLVDVGNVVLLVDVDVVVVAAPHSLQSLYENVGEANVPPIAEGLTVQHAFVSNGALTE